VVCGDCHLDWFRFSVAIIFLDYIKPEHVFDLTNIGLADGWKRILFSRDGHVNLDVPIVSTIATWKKLGLIREQNMVLRKAESESHSQMLHQGTLRSYQRFVHRVSYQHTLFRKSKPAFIVASFVVLSSSLELIGLFFQKNNSPPDWISPAITAPACQDRNMTSCIKFCNTPNLNMSDRAKAEFCGWSPSGHTLLPWLSIPAGVILLYFLALMNSQFAPNTPLPRITKSIREKEMTLDTTVDITDGISTRSATNPLDMAFGMHSVMERLLNRTLPAPDYAKPKGDVYKDITLQLLDTMWSL
jgi:hypothetical protein